MEYRFLILYVYGFGIDYVWSKDTYYIFRDTTTITANVGVTITHSEDNVLQNVDVNTGTKKIASACAYLHNGRNAQQDMFMIQ